MRRQRQQSQNGFTLTEILVVVTIIGVLLGVTLPIVSNARGASRRVACRAQLADIGRLFQMYLNDSKGRLPWVNPIPSLQPPLEGKSITELLKGYTKDVSIGWKCPSDTIRRKINGTPEGFQTYFDREGISYLYNPQLAFRYPGKQINDTRLYRDKQQNRLPIFWEFEPFHGRENTLGSMNYLFADMHVGDLGSE
jgi:prepilin-type N-terminal cleavage/methylation domain-containing protein